MIVYLWLVAGVVVLVLIILPFAAPGLLARLWHYVFKAKAKTAGTSGGKPGAARKLSPNEILARQIEQLTPGQTLRYRIPEIWGGSFIAAELNPQYPKKGGKYILSMENAVNGMPGDKKTLMYDSDESIHLANSIMEREGKLFVEAKEVPAGAQGVSPGAMKEKTGVR